MMVQPPQKDQEVLKEHQAPKAVNPRKAKMLKTKVTVSQTLANPASQGKTEERTPKEEKEKGTKEKGKEKEDTNLPLMGNQAKVSRKEMGGNQKERERECATTVANQGI